MNEPSLLQYFAVNKEGVSVAINEVARGLACECHCPACGSPLIARQGEVRTWHFAHITDHDCESGAETALHKAAKDILRRERTMAVPEISVTETVTLQDGRSGTATAVRESTVLTFEEVWIEETMGDIRPDVTGRIGEQRYLIEIAVNHFVDEEKNEKLQALQLPAIEIALDVLLHEAWTWDLLREHVVSQLVFKRWLFHPDEELLRADAHQRATLIAEMQRPKATPDCPLKRQYFYGGAMLYTYEWPESIVVWKLGSMRDDHFRDFARLMRLLGGVWQPAKDNWRLPTRASAELRRILQHGQG